MFLNRFELRSNLYTHQPGYQQILRIYERIFNDVINELIFQEKRISSLEPAVEK